MSLLQKIIVVSIVQKDIRDIFRIMSNSYGGASLWMQLMADRNLFQRSHKTESYRLKEHEAVCLKRQYLYSSWKYLICFFVWEKIFLQGRFKFAVTFGSRPGAGNLNMPFEGFVFFLLKTCEEISQKLFHIYQCRTPPSKKFVFIYFNESPLKMMENALKLFSFVRYLHFCPDFLVILVM